MKTKQKPAYLTRSVPGHLVRLSHIYIPEGSNLET